MFRVSFSTYVPEGPFFFLSYARRDRNGDAQRVIERFYDDLETELAARLGWSRPLGFRDSQSIETGEDWPDALRTALNACCVFVPILSRGLFGREACGQEWAFFEQRVKAAKATAGKRPSFVQPVLLLGPERLKPIPEVVGRAQNRVDAFPDRYNEGGLRTIMLLEDEPQYLRFLHAFSERLVTVYEQHGAPPQCDLPGIEAMPNAFQVVRSQTASTEAPLSHIAQFYYVAGRREELTELRTYLDCYGDCGGVDWHPYMPDVNQPVGLLATGVAIEENFLYEWVRLDDQLISRLDAAAATHTVAILIVDPWTARLPRYERLLTEFDERSYPNTAVVIPRNPNDPDAAGDGDEDVVSLFANRAVVGDGDQFAVGIASPGELKSELARKLQATKSRVEKQMQIRRKASGQGPARLPVIWSGES